MSKVPKILILGSNSFSGASFAKFALTKGVQVIGISRSQQPQSAFLPYTWSKHKKHFQFHRLDINTDLEDILDLIFDEKPQYILNFAAQSMVSQSWTSPEDWFQTNTIGTVKLLNNLQKNTTFLKSYVHITTPEVYGHTHGWVDENATYNPSTPYATSRAASDMFIKNLVENYDFPAVCTRASNVYGPGQSLYRIIPHTIMSIKLGTKLKLHGGGVSERSFIHINDVSDATWRIMTKANYGNIFHISTNEIITIKELVTKICSKMNTSFEENVEIVDERPGKDTAYRLDSSKLRKSLGWKDEITLSEGLDECINWTVSHFEKLKKEKQHYVHKK